MLWIELCTQKAMYLTPGTYEYDLYGNWVFAELRQVYTEIYKPITIALIKRGKFRDRKRYRQGKNSMGGQ